MNKILIMLLFVGFTSNVAGQEYNDKGILNSIVGGLGSLLSVAEDVAYTLLKPVQNLIKENSPAIYENQFRKMDANVRVGGPICLQEKIYRDTRFSVVKSAQEKMLGLKLKDEEVLDIGFSCSGGGWRAMCCSLGSFVGAKKIGLLDTVMCMSAVSGSAWFIAPWLNSGMNIYDYKKRLIKIASDGLGLKDEDNTTSFFDNVWVKFAYSQPLTAIDLYGGLFTNRLFNGLVKDSNRVYMSDQRKIIADGMLPLPIYTSTLGEVNKKEHWFEFTPFEAGSRWLGAYVPIWSFGRHFKYGKSKSHAPEQNLGFYLGMFGSAFAVDFEDLYDYLFKEFQYPKFLLNLPYADVVFAVIRDAFEKLAHSDVGNIRLTSARIPNFVYKLEGVPHNDYKELKLLDAGSDFSNPVFATYRKFPYADAPDVIFVFDSDAFVNFKPLQALMDYANKNNLKFPKIEKFEVGKQIISVFKDDNDLDVPVIVYMPRINGFDLAGDNKYKNNYYTGLLDGFDIEKAVYGGFAATYYFKYTQVQAETLMAMTEFNILAVEEKIKEILTDRIKAKRVYKKNI